MSEEESNPLYLEGIDDLEEERLIPAGDVDLEIVSVAQKPLDFKNKDGDDVHAEVVVVTLVAPDEEDAAAMSHTLWMPGNDDDEKQAKGKLRDFKRFMLLIGVKVEAEPEVENWVGISFKGTVKHTISKKDNETYANLKVPRF